MKSIFAPQPRWWWVGVAGILLYLWLPLFQRPLWHDEEQIAFAARQWETTGQKSYFDGHQIVGENIHHPLNEHWDLEVNSPAEVWLAAGAHRIASWWQPSGDSWRYSRWLFAFFGMLTGFWLSHLVCQLTGSRLMEFLSLGTWFLIPWVWTLSVQLRYYSLSWLLIIWAMAQWALPDKQIVWKLSGLLIALYFVSWPLVPFIFVLLGVMDRFRPESQRIPLLKIFLVAGIPLIIHACFFSTQASGMSTIPTRFSMVFWSFHKHLVEFNLDGFPLLLLGLMLWGGWRYQELRPWLAACVITLLFFLIPAFYTRLALMFLPLFVVSALLTFDKWVRRRPVVASLCFILWVGTHFFQSLPGCLLQTLSERVAAKTTMPLNRHWSSIWQNLPKAWNQVFSPSPSPIDTLALFLKEEAQPSDQVICAMGGTGLGRLTDLTINWKMPAWGQDRQLPRHLISPEGVRFVVVCSQWPYLMRRVTWSTEILRAIEEGWILAKEFEWDLVDSRFSGAYPFPFAADRQAWPQVELLKVWVLDQPLSASQAQRVMNLGKLPVYRPAGLSVDQDPEVVWGYPYCLKDSCQKASSISGRDRD